MKECDIDRVAMPEVECSPVIKVQVKFGSLEAARKFKWYCESNQTGMIAKMFRRKRARAVNIHDFEFVEGQKYQFERAK